MSRRPRLLLTCEHGGNSVPAAYRRWFRGASRALASHRGYDLGALAMAKALSRRLSAPLVAASVTRLLVDLNRSETHPGVISEFLDGVGREEREALLARFHRPHRLAVRSAIATLAGDGTVVHVGVHSFTPVLNGETRNADLGLLYDPARRAERALCSRWTRALREAGLRTRRNYPYRGNADGLTTRLRSTFPARSYLGLELEVNQALSVNAADRRRLVPILARTLEQALKG